MDDHGPAHRRNAHRSGEAGSSGRDLGGERHAWVLCCGAGRVSWEMSARELVRNRSPGLGSDLQSRREPGATTGPRRGTRTGWDPQVGCVGAGTPGDTVAGVLRGAPLRRHARPAARGHAGLRVCPRQGAAGPRVVEVRKSPRSPGAVSGRARAVRGCHGASPWPSRGESVAVSGRARGCAVSGRARGCAGSGRARRCAGSGRGLLVPKPGVVRPRTGSRARWRPTHGVRGRVRSLAGPDARVNGRHVRDSRTNPGSSRSARTWNLAIRVMSTLNTPRNVRDSRIPCR